MTSGFVYFPLASTRPGSARDTSARCRRRSKKEELDNGGVHHNRYDEGGGDDTVGYQLRRVVLSTIAACIGRVALHLHEESVCDHMCYGTDAWVRTVS